MTHSSPRCSACPSFRKRSVLAKNYECSQRSHEEYFGIRVGRLDDEFCTEELAVDRVAASSRHAVTIFADQLFTNAPKRSSALETLSPAAAKPRRKCECASKQSPGASRIPRSGADWQNERSFSPLTSQGNAVMPPCGGIQPSTSRWSAMKRSRSLRFRVAASWVLPSTTSRLRIAISERISPVVVLQIEK